MKTNAEIRAAARQQLGGRIFHNNWLMAVLVVLIEGVITGFAGTILPGVGAILISGPITYGIAAMFLKQARDREQMKLNDIFNGFKQDFSTTFLIGLMSAIFIFLWSLLFVIPGIVKTYAYSFACYVKADHPDYDWRQCIDESKRLTHGYKMRLFLLDLSFIGWAIVGALCFGVGTLWVISYMEAAKAEFYHELAR